MSRSTRTSTGASGGMDASQASAMAAAADLSWL